MDKRQLGNTDLRVTAPAYGAMELRHVDEQEAARLLNAVLDGGINYIDKSPNYGPSSAHIGKAISHRRDEFYLATKCGCNVGPAGKGLNPSHIWSREKLLANIEDSLRTLNTDHIDAWQLHGPWPDTLAGSAGDELIHTMQELKQQGKVRAIGISFRNGGPGDGRYPAGHGFEGAQEFMTRGVFDVMQLVYGGLTRKSEIAIARAAERGIGIVVRGVVKRYHDNYDELFDKAGLTELCESGESRNSFLVRFALSHPAVGAAIVGSKSRDHIAENIAAAAKEKLPDAVYRAAQQRLDAVGIVADQAVGVG